MSDDLKLHEQMRPASRFALIGLFVLASLYTLYFASALLLPMILALLLCLSLAPIVQALKKKLRLPAPLGAAMVVGALVAAMGYGVVSLTEPARAWIDKAPDVLGQVEIKLRGVRQSVKEVARIAEQAEEIAGQADGSAENTASPAPPDLVGRTLSATASFLVSVVSTVILVFLLLAYGGPLTRQIVRMIPAEERRGAIKALRSFHTDIARYIFLLSLLSLLSAGLGATAGLAMYWLGMPTPILWAVMVAVLNFVPYLGAVISLVVVTLVAILAIEPVSQALLVPAVVLVLTVFEGELLRAIVVGRYFTLSPIVVFLGILLSVWLWGVVGALIAVPLLVSLRIFCINIPALRPCGEFISIGAKHRA